MLLALALGPCVLSACGREDTAAQLRAAEEERQTVVEGMLETAARNRFRTCGPETQCFLEIDRYAESVQEIVGLIAARLSEAEPDPEDPDAILTMGGPGSGKTTVLEALGLCQDEVVQVNPDEFKEDLSEYTVAIAARDRLAAARVHRESSMLAERTRDQAIETFRDFCYDGTLRRTEAALELIHVLQERGYEVIVVTATVPFDVAWERIQARARETGRFVPRDYAEQAHKGVAAHDERILEAVDAGYVFSTDVPLGDPPVLVARYIDGRRLDPGPP